MGEIIEYENIEHSAEATEYSEPEIAKYTLKDSVFTSLFKEKKYLIQLYRTLHPEDTETTEEDLTNITIKNVLTDGIYNDLGFMAGDKLMILVEAQASWTMNIIIRAFLYLAQSYHDYLGQKREDLYQSKKVRLPKPELYVIFTGERIKRPEMVSLSEEFFNGEESALEVRVKVIYGDGSWEDAASGEPEKKDIISQYIIFTKVYNEQVKRHKRTRKAIAETIRICKDRNVLRDFLKSREKEVVNIMMALFDEKRIMEIHIENRVKEEVENRVKEQVEERVKEQLEERVEARLQEATKEAAEKAAKEAAEKAAKETKEAAEKAAKEAAEKAAKEVAEKTANANRKTAEGLLQNGKLSIEEIAACIPELSIEEVSRIKENLMQAV